MTVRVESVRVIALDLSCEACGATCRITPDDGKGFCGWAEAHLMPTIDYAEVLVAGRLRNVPVEFTR